MTLRGVALIVLGAAAAGSIASMLVVGRNSPLFLMVLFFLWVLSPHAGFMLADRLSKRSAVLSGQTLYWVMLIVALGSVALYADVALRPPKATPAARFVMVPAVSWLLMAIAFAIAAFAAKRAMPQRGHH